MISTEIPLSGAGWNLFAYPMQETRKVTEALEPIEGTYNIVWGYEPDAPEEERWCMYSPDAPNHLNDLTSFEFGKGYWIHIAATEGITLYLKGSTSNIITSSLDESAAPPAVYYGAVHPISDFVSTAGKTVTAWVDKQLCGRSRTQEVDGQIIYAVRVLAILVETQLAAAHLDDQLLSKSM